MRRALGRIEIIERLAHAVEAIIGTAAQVMCISEWIARGVAVIDDRADRLDDLRICAALDFLHGFIKNLRLIIVRFELRANLLLFASLRLLVFFEQLFILLLERVTLLLELLEIGFVLHHLLEVDLIRIDLGREIDRIFERAALELGDGLFLRDLQDGTRNRADFILRELHVLRLRITLDIDADLLDCHAHGLLPRGIARDFRRVVVAHDVDARRLDGLHGCLAGGRERRQHHERRREYAGCESFLSRNLHRPFPLFSLL